MGLLQGTCHLCCGVVLVGLKEHGADSKGPILFPVLVILAYRALQPVCRVDEGFLL